MDAASHEDARKAAAPAQVEDRQIGNDLCWRCSWKSETTVQKKPCWYCNNTRSIAAAKAYEAADKANLGE